MPNEFPLKEYLSNIYNKRFLITKISRMDLRKTYIQSSLGFLWVILDPLILISLFYIIFSAGLKKTFTNTETFIPYFITGLITYYYFTDCIKRGISSISGYGYLVKKVNFKTELLPIVKIINCLKVHCVLLVILFIILLSYGIKPSLYWLQLPIVLAIQTIFLIGLANLLGTLDLFFKDIRKIIPTITRLLFWGTPIFWSLQHRIPEKYHVIFKLNPLNFYVDAYRNTLIYERQFFTPNLIDTFHLILAFTTFLLGFTIFRRFKNLFGELL